MLEPMDEEGDGEGCLKSREKLHDNGEVWVHDTRKERRLAARRPGILTGLRKSWRTCPIANVGVMG